MLKKLIKNEFKENYKEMLMLFGLSFGIFVFLGVILRLEAYKLMTIMLTLGVGICFAIEIFVIININRSFNKRIFSKEGYLTFSLPVRMRDLLFAKYLTNIIWIIASYVVLIINIFILFIIAGDVGFEFFEIEIENIGVALVSATYYFVLILLSIILLLTIVIIILCILNAGKIKKHKVLIGILLFYGSSTLFNIFFTFNIVPFDIRFLDGAIKFVRVEIGFFEGSTLNYMLFNVLAIIGGLFLVKHLMEKKIELE